jgi:hypothetical protein
VDVSGGAPERGVLKFVAGGEEVFAAGDRLVRGEEGFRAEAGGGFGEKLGTG